MRTLFGSALLCAVTLSGAEPNGYVGSQACAACHPTQYSRQSKSAHARSLYPAAQHPLAGFFTPADAVVRPPNFHFLFRRSAEGLQVRADDGQYVMELPLDWAFGAGEHAVTFVSRVDNEFYLEHSLSYYPDIRSFDLTPRHEELPAGTLQQAMGQPLRIQSPRFTAVDCFQCHSTGPVSVGAAGRIEVTEPGVRCEVCHGPGRLHREAALRGDLAQVRQLIQKPSRLSSEELNRSCGRCHRVMSGDSASFNWDSPWNVRHQPPYLVQSRCFRDSAGQLSCLTCHDPHDPVRRNDPAYYRVRCNGCHRTGHHPPQRICLEEKDPDCTSCHMPLVTASQHLKFKNHWIGIYQKGAPLKPLARAKGGSPN
ncbi:MAG TPA: multiheme c-type cytochrome [Bryobacterales bacterium]|nr:multiheme c-type cytochrome [Bryobacterales bacterium]